MLFSRPDGGPLIGWYINGDLGREISRETLRMAFVVLITSLEGSCGAAPVYTNGSDSSSSQRSVLAIVF